MNIIKDIVIKNPLSVSDEQSFFLYSKLEKITMAVYLITDIFPKEEPLKVYLRERCLELLSFIMSLKDQSQESEIRISSLSGEILSLLKVSASANLISEMNYRILINEYNKFLKLVERQKENKEIFEKDFFKEEYKEALVPQGQIYKGHSKGHKQTTINNVLNEDLKDTVTEIVPKRVRRKSSGVFKKEKLDRRESIIKFIKDNKEVTVKDITKVVKGFSEKTIQRELVNMLEEGVLKKEGERRWSRYTLKK